jgi:hypothetical protein
MPNGAPQPPDNGGVGLALDAFRITEGLGSEPQRVTGARRSSMTEYTNHGNRYKPRG